MKTWCFIFTYDLYGSEAEHHFSVDADTFHDASVLADAYVKGKLAASMTELSTIRFDRLGTNEKRLEELKSILQDPCEYCCENPKPMQTKSIYMFCKIKHVSKNFFNLQFGETINGPIEGFIRFSFCPMCGRKLEDAK